MFISSKVKKAIIDEFYAKVFSNQKEISQLVCLPERLNFLISSK